MYAFRLPYTESPVNLSGFTRGHPDLASHVKPEPRPGGALHRKRNSREPGPPKPPPVPSRRRQLPRKRSTGRAPAVQRGSAPSPRVKSPQLARAASRDARAPPLRRQKADKQKGCVSLLAPGGKVQRKQREENATLTGRTAVPARPTNKSAAARGLARLTACTVARRRPMRRARNAR